MAITIKDLARHLDLSITTVSHALSDPPTGYVAPQTRERVRATAARLGYQPNVYARRLVKRRAEGVVGLFSADLPAVGPGMLKLRALQDHLLAHGYEVPMMVGSLSASEQHGEMMAAICRQRPAALVWMLLRPDNRQLVEQARRYAEEGGVLVCMDEDVELPADQVVFDRAHNTYLATRHLLALGHRRLGVFLGASRLDHPRGQGARRALAEVGLDPAFLHVFDLPGVSDYRMGERLADAFLRLERRPTGMVILNDQTAAAFLAVVSAAGVRVPHQLSVVGHDNQPWGAYLPVPLTTVTHPYEELAEAAARMVHERLSGEETGPPRRRVISSELILRASTAPPE